MTRTAVPEAVQPSLFDTPAEQTPQTPTTSAPATPQQGILSQADRDALNAALDEETDTAWSDLGYSSR